MRSGAIADFAERSPAATRLLVLCFDGGDAAQGYVLENGGTLHDVPAALIAGSGAWSPDSGGVALFSLGACMTVWCGRIVYYDIASRAVFTLLSNDAGVPQLSPQGPTS